MGINRTTAIVVGTLVIPVLVIAAGYVIFSRFIGLHGFEEPPLVAFGADDFESFQLDWQLGHGWEHRPAGGPGMTPALVASGHPEPTRYGDHVFGDVVVQVRLWVEEGEGRLHLRAGEAGSYAVGLGPTGRVRLYRNESILSEEYADAVISGPAWHTIRFGIFGNQLVVDVDGKEMFSLADTAPDGPLPPGGIAFSAGETPATFTVDDFAVWVPATEDEQP